MADLAAALRAYARDAFRWRRGRQGTGYDEMSLLTAPWPLRFEFTRVEGGSRYVLSIGWALGRHV